jgi:hypothetical protein
LGDLGQLPISKGREQELTPRTQIGFATGPHLPFVHAVAAGIYQTEHRDIA